METIALHNFERFKRFQSFLEIPEILPSSVESPFVMSPSSVAGLCENLQIVSQHYELLVNALLFRD